MHALEDMTLPAWLATQILGDIPSDILNPLASEVDYHRFHEDNPNSPSSHFSTMLLGTSGLALTMGESLRI